MKPGNLSVDRKRCQFLRDETCVIPSETRAFLFPKVVPASIIFPAR